MQRKRSLLVEKQKDFSHQKYSDSQPEKSQRYRRKNSVNYCWFVKVSQWKGKFWIKEFFRACLDFN